MKALHSLRNEEHKKPLLWHRDLNGMERTELMITVSFRYEDKMKVHMEMKIEEIQGIRDSALITTLTEVWDESVRTSHQFLSEQDLQHIKPYVEMALREVRHLIVIYQDQCPKGFMGILDGKIEMLFLSPDCIGLRWGSYLVDWAICTHGVTMVDVNEQNEQAALFYERKGFRVISRNEYDEQGNPFPILHLKLADTTHMLAVSENKKQFLELLLLGDEQESMIDRYLERGELHILFDLEELKPTGVAVVTEEGEDICELKNLAIAPAFQRKGLGTKVVDYLCRHYRHRFHTMQVGTGDSRQTTSFYRHCGFNYSHTLKNFFTDNYDHPIVEEGKVLKDMLYFSKRLK